MAVRLEDPWLDPVSVDPSLFVNRTVEVEKLKSRLRSWNRYKHRDKLVLIRGDRGVGKSIFGCAVLQDIAIEYPREVIPVVVDERFLGDRDSLVKVAKKLAEATRDAFERVESPVEERDRWVKPLLEMIYTNRISQGSHHTTSREKTEGGEYGFGLFDVLKAQGSIHWKDRTDMGLKTESTLEITNELLAAAITALLGHLKEHFTVIIFFDDLDQAQRMDNVESSRSTLSGILALSPCIALLHLRSEVPFPDVVREIYNKIDLDPLGPEELRKILKKRLERALPEDKAIAKSPEGWAPFEAFLSATGNPYVLLRWLVAAIEDSPAWPPEPDWWTEARLRQLAVLSTHGARIPPELCIRLGRLIDRLKKSTGLAETELLTGRALFDDQPATDRISSAELDLLRQNDYLRLVDRFDQGRGLSLDPALELLRPSLLQKVLHARL
jgi:hypothetical protein